MKTSENKMGGKTVRVNPCFPESTAKGHLTKGVSITRVLVERNVHTPKPVLGYFTLTSMASAANWPGVAKGLPSMPVPMVLLGRVAFF